MEDQTPEPRLHGVSQRVHLRDRRRLALLARLHPGSFHRARVRRQEAVLDGRVEDGAQPAVALGRRRGSGPLAEQGCVPRPHRGRVQPAEGLGAEGREDVEPEEALVELLGPRAQRLTS